MSETIINQAKAILLEPFGLTENKLLNAMGELLTHRIDYADFYFEYNKTENLVLDEGIVKTGSFSIDQGFGVRAISGEKTAFSYADDIAYSRLIDAVKTTRTIANHGQSQVALPKSTVPFSFSKVHGHNDVFNTLSASQKIDLLNRVETLAKQKDSRIIQVIAGLAAEYDVVLVYRHDGRLSADIRPLVRLSVTVIAEEKGRREVGSSGGGARLGYTYFTDELIEQYVEEATQSALINLQAKPAPAGTKTVVLGPGWPGVLLHEAVGHGLEGDFNRKGSSAFANRIGEKVAADGVTVVDDGTIKNRRGSLNIDDEGNATQRTVLIENGVLKTYLQDSLNARLMKRELTGNGRRESYASLPLPRMTNTFMLAGKTDPEEIIRSVKSGLYAKNFSGGQVDITSGQFVFSASDAYMIENGRLTYPVKGMTLIGNGPEILKQVSLIGNDLKLDAGVGMCGKEGQTVPVGVGMPTIKIDEMTVGGTLES